MKTITVYEGGVLEKMYYHENMCSNGVSELSLVQEIAAVSVKNGSCASVMTGVIAVIGIVVGLVIFFCGRTYSYLRSPQAATGWSHAKQVFAVFWPLFVGLIALSGMAMCSWWLLPRLGALVITILAVLVECGLIRSVIVTTTAALQVYYRQVNQGLEGCSSEEGDCGQSCTDCVFAEGNICSNNGG